MVGAGNSGLRLCLALSPALMVLHVLDGSAALQPCSRITATLPAVGISWPHPFGPRARTVPTGQSAAVPDAAFQPAPGATRHASRLVAPSIPGSVRSPLPQGVHATPPALYAPRPARKVASGQRVSSRVTLLRLTPAGAPNPGSTTSSVGWGDGACVDLQVRQWWVEHTRESRASCRGAHGPVTDHPGH